MSKIVADYENNSKNTDTQTQFDSNVIDELIDDWKTFIQYWIESPIPIHIIRYEDLVSEPDKVLKNLLLFMLGVESIDSSIIEAKLMETLLVKVSSVYLATGFELEKHTKSLFSNKST
eukprot:CAMPEP_0170533816 /NCGR_PEP_ID=MMETSP0209-20121228/85481_1 /TAXON_ID=665100 ORGANISM="Litonotus pictus, Strain P1" /NCGR_SAMPLE_ID=MMETSP0209 /ASSEMBLY_ACC=CAM_ASM_000301 /LENGTH=117 /DNA_ID=CAMNT_0010832119 /DNA_START=306 /DNA_END=655 /DNA_ORIENTATION=+